MSHKYSHFPYIDFPYIDDFCDDEVFVFSTMGKGPAGDVGNPGPQGEKGDPGKDGILSFDTVADMQASTDLEVGMTVHTHGFHEIGDGGAAFYLISNDGMPNGLDILECENGLHAHFIPTDIITPIQLGAHGDGVMPDDNSLNKCFDYNRCVDGLNKTYMLNVGIDATSENFIFRNAILVGTVSNETYIHAHGQEIYSGIGTINKGDLQLRANVTLESNKKYFVRCTNDVSSVSTYTTGVYLPFINYIYSGVVQTDVVDGKLVIFEGINVDIQNVNIPNVPANKSGMSFANCSGNVSNCFINSNGGLMGIGVTGSGIVVEGCEINGFLDINLVWNRGGYGVNAVGQNIIVKDNVISNCKHCITSGISTFWSNNLIYQGNTLIQNTNFITNLGYDTDWNHGYWAIVDFHALVTNAYIVNNVIMALGRQTSALIWGNFNLRCKSLLVENNIFFADNAQEKQFGPLEQVMESLVIRNNVALGEWFFNMAMIDDVEFNLTFENNVFKRSIIYRKANGGIWHIKNNDMSRIVCLDKAEHIDVSGNTLEVYSAYQAVIQIVDCDHAYICGNTCTKVSGGNTIICNGNATILNNLLINATSVNDIQYHTEQTAIANNYNQNALLVTGNRV